MEDPDSAFPEPAMADPDPASLEAAMEVPVTVSLGPTGPLLRKLHSLMAPGDSLPDWLGADEFGLLRDDLTVLCISLKNMSKDEDASFMARWWMNMVRELCYDTEDHLDEIYGAGAQEDFSELLARAKDASESLKYLEWSPKTTKPDSGEAGASCFRSNSGKVRVPDPPKKLVELLALDDGEKTLKVIPIHGCAGVGKTTVARTLYHTHGWKFQCRAFVTVSRNPDMRGFLTAMLSQLKAPRPQSFAGVPDLIDVIRKHLEGKRYFIVVDDLWTSSVWNIISSAFPRGDSCGRIITTTQIDDVALACCSYDSRSIYNMEPLNDHESKKIFFGILFGYEDLSPTDINEFPVEIIRKCGGLPLAIESIASLLASEAKIVREKWKDLQDSLPSISEGMKDVPNLIYNTLPHLMYKGLPPRLRTCLLYLGMYPQGSVIMKEELMNLWVVEGFLSAMGGRVMEEIAESYFDELISRRIVQAVDISNIGEVLSCTVHQLVLDFIRHKSMEDNFFINVDYLQSTPALPDKVRRLSVQFGGVKSAYIPESIITSQVRSLTFWGFFKCVPSIRDFGLLRVLVLHIWADRDKKSFDLTTIGKLFQLKYIKIECNIVVKLPGKIRRLQQLGTLHVDARLSAVPSDIVYLNRLWHLRLPSVSILPSVVAQMAYLRTLGYFDLSCHSEENILNLGRLTSLQDLHLTCSKVQPPAENLKKNVQLLGSILEKLSILQSVTLVPASGFSCAASVIIPYDGFSMVSPPSDLLLRRIELSRHCCIFFNLPQWFGELRKLCILKIALKESSKEDIDILNGLPSLTSLTLYILKTAHAERIVISNVGFQVLRYFKFVCPTPCLSFEHGAMPRVQKLNLGFNSDNMGPQTIEDVGFGFLKCLTEISVKFGSRVADGFDIKAAESALEAAVSNRTSTPIIRIKRMDVIADGEEEKSTATEEKGDTTFVNRHDIREGERKKMESSEEHVNKPSVDSRYARTDCVSTPNTELVTGAMGSLLPKLLQLVKDEYNLKTGVKRSIQSLYKELEAMKAVLEKVAKLEPDRQHKLLDVWASDVRDFSYDAEDVIDSLPLEFDDSHAGLEGLIRRLHKLVDAGNAHREIASTIKDDGRIVANPGAPSVHPGLSALYIDRKELVGIVASRDEVLKLIHSASDELKTVSIVGLGGLGKTTLAEAVYARTEGQFDYTAFVTVSRNPDMMKVFSDILRQIDWREYRHFDRGMWNWDEWHLMGEVRRLLANKRYLLVLDDIWDVESWEKIKRVLIDGKCGSRVVTTTRFFHVAEKAGDVYKLKALSRLDSEALFNKIRCFGVEDVPIVLPEVLENIMQKCDGVPLAIITIANLLAEKHPTDWSKVVDLIGFGSEVGYNAGVDNTRKILEFSYYELPYHLRACLLYLHIFPKGCLIKKETLIWKWAAEGFIAQIQNMGLFEVGETYFNELINRNMIMPVDSHRGIIIGCRVHHLFLDLICYESTAENFVVVLDGSNEQNPPARKARRFAVHNQAAEQRNFLDNIFHESVRSFSATMCHFRSEVSLSRFKVLRVLAIEQCTLKQVGSYNLKGVGNLVYLRYLGLYNTRIMELPEEIGNLILLQTLDTRGTKIRELPETVGQLTQLKCLRTDEIIRVPDCIGKLTSLEELQLDKIHRSENIVKELGKLAELRDLHIWIQEFGENGCKTFVESMGNLKKLQVLVLMSSTQVEGANWEGYVPPRQLRDLHLTIPSSRLPAWINVSLVPILSHLCVDVKAVEEQDLDVLGALTELVSLQLIMPSNVFPSIKGGSAFPKLRCFRTYAPFRFLPGAMPRLESLYFRVFRDWKRAGFEFDFTTLSNLPQLQKVQLVIDSLEAKAAAKHAVDAHPNGPILTILPY